MVPRVMAGHATNSGAWNVRPAKPKPMRQVLRVLGNFSDILGPKFNVVVGGGVSLKL